MKTCEVQSVNEVMASMPEESSPPRKNGELYFEEPWESRAFGMAIALYDQKIYSSWDDFRSLLVEKIASWENTDGEKNEWSYYDHWMGALEELVMKNGILDEQEIEKRANEFLSGVRDEF
ncbi:nitrile hydratase accessory protein [Domibacillus epiphyticus]|uniref:Nitrile hydratase accessory protein n=1 Tax=Domibacillus epiphyticus TaxID=1714355 RepID=A0A1V2ACL4_9BACI|nr:nitrile hydratase accessory protein [Domibacillus epiphyticus]OMP68738.1 nitrile hydratase accessory protein [Domibacillus epiphyticus]